MTPLHPALRAMVEAAERFPPLHEVPLPILRENAPRRLETGLPKEEVGAVEEALAESAAGPVPVRIYRPAAGEQPPPLVVFLHGGGFAICNLETHDAICRGLCNRAGAVVVSVDYRLAPEHPYPTGLDDCEAATRWALAEGTRRGWDASRAALCGDSAGGALATGVALRRLAAGYPALQALALLYPVADHPSAGHRSYETCATGCGLTAETMHWFWSLYLPDPSLADEPEVSPVRAPTLVGLPPALVVTAGHDVLRDEGEALARALTAAGVPVAARRFESLNHGFLHWAPVVDEAGIALDEIGAWLRAALRA